MSLLDNVIDPISKIFFCNRCELCGEVIELKETLCDSCKGLNKLSGDICLLCGHKKSDCSCDKKKSEYKAVIAPYYYEGSIITAVYNFKEYDMPFLSKRFGNDICEMLDEYYSDIRFDYITYVPLRLFHQRKREFNQSQLIAKEISRLKNIELVDAIEKVRYTGVQHHKSHKERQVNVYGAYDISDEFKDKLSDKNILLIDDIKTTGSTLNECAKMLKLYGANSVYCATLAVAKKNRKSKDK